MKKWLEIIQLIVLIIISIIFVCYILMKNNSEKVLKNVMETFQLEKDFHSIFFDISANYYDNTPEEMLIPPNTGIVDDLILDVGGKFGEVDVEQIPWDSENKELTMSEALWGIVPPQASLILYKKIYLAQQLDSMNNLPFDPMNNQHYDDPMFDFGTDNQALAKTMEVVDGVAQFAVPMLAGHLSEKLLKDTPLSHAKPKMEKPNKSEGFLLKKLTPRKLRQFASGFKKAVLKGGRAVAAFAKSAVKEIIRLLKGIVSIGTPEFVKAAAKGLARSAKGSGSFAAIQAFKRAAIIFGKYMKTIFKMIIGSALAMFSLSWIPVIGPELDAIYMFPIMVIMMICSLPGMPITNAIQQWGTTDGCCPPGTFPLDQALDPAVETIISLVPVAGDVIGFIYPVACLEKNTGAMTSKQGIKLPKYLEYQWLSSYYFDWPQYDCTMGYSAVQGKYNSAPSYDPTDSPLNTFLTNMVKKVGDITHVNLTGILGTLGVGGIFTIPPVLNNWTYGPYTDFNSIVKDPYGHLHVQSQLDGFTKLYDSNYIVPPGTNFFYCDFSHPNILLQMAQFYYDWAVRHPIKNDDGTLTIQYISMINYVAASSLVTCDIMCQMNNITYDPVNGKRYSEVTSFNHDRRFYFNAPQDAIAPLYWEDSGDSNWRDIDDRYDDVHEQLNTLIHSSPFTNTTVSVDLLATAYRLMVRSSNDYERAISHASTLDDVLPFYAQQLSDDANFKNLLDDMYPQYKSQSNWQDTVATNTNLHYIKLGTTVPPPTWNYGAGGYNALDMSQFAPLSNLHSNAVSNLTLYLSTFTGCSNAYWNYQKTLPNQQPTYNLYSNYTVYGCTHIDSTAGGVIDPDICNEEIDIRKEVNFPTEIFFNRCPKTFMDMRQCIDLSNVELVVNAYSIKYPNQHIKSIQTIKPMGKNVCQFTWDEVTVDPVSQMESNYTKVTNNILYQIDLSSCTFCLPGPSNSPNIYGTTIGTQVSQTLTAPPSSVPIYKNPVADSNSPNYAFNTTTLQYYQGFYYQPTIGTDAQTSNTIVSMTIISNVDYIKQFVPSTGAEIPPLVRPKKPIRVHYPKPHEKALGNLSNDVCALPANIHNFILDYNGVPTNNKITKVVRAYTTTSNICDMEVDILVGTNVQRRTLTYNMKPEAFQNIEGFDTLQQYTYDSQIPTQQGLNIQKNTNGLPGEWSTIGYGFSIPYLSTLNPKVSENNRYFNDDLIKGFTNSTRGLKNTTNTFLVGLAGTQHLGDSNCTNKCSDPDIQQRIIEQYNLDGFPNARYDVSQNTMLNIITSVTASPTKCHLIFENEKDTYADAFSEGTFMYNANNDPYDPKHNYSTENRLFFKEVNMKQLPGTCSFLPTSPGPGQTYKDISATDLALSTQFDMESLTNGTGLSNITTKFPVRSTCQVMCDTLIANQAIADYQNTTGSLINNVYAYMKTGYDTCDYYVNNSVYYVQPRATGDTAYSNVEGVLRVKYTYPAYNTTNLIEGQSYKCTATGTAVYRAVRGFLCQYPTVAVASSWNPSWNTNIITIDCTNEPFGPSMLTYPTYPILPKQQKQCTSFTYNAGNYKMQVPGDTLTALDKDISPMFDYDPNNTTVLNTEANKNLINYIRTRPNPSMPVGEQAKSQQAV